MRKKTVLTLMILTIIAKIIGFSKDIVLSYFYGTSNISDIYLISMTIPSVLFGFLGKAISTGYIPTYSKIEVEYGVIEGNKYTNNLINVSMLICTILLVVILVFTQPIVKAFASGFEDESLQLAVVFTRICIIGIYFSLLNTILGGFLQIKNNFVAPALVSISMNFIIILSIIISYKHNIILLAIGSIIGSASQLMILIFYAYRNGYNYKAGFSLADEHLKKMLYLVLPVVLGSSVNQINKLVDRTIASQVAVGGISALNYASKLNLFVEGIFVMAISTSMYPTISKMAVGNDKIGFKKSISEAIGAINLLVVPTTIGAMIFAQPIIRLLFGRGAFDSQAITMTSYALFFYAIGMVGYGHREVLSKAFYSLQDTKTPMNNAVIAMVMNIGLNIILSKHLGIGGLALATSVSAIFCTVLLFISLRKKIGSLGMKQISISFLKILFASLIMGAMAKISFNYFTANIFSQNLSLIISIGIGALTYFVVICFMKIEDVDIIANALKKKLSRNKAVV